jgi:replication factor A1
MKISELKSGQGNINVEGVIAELGEKKTFVKFGRELVLTHAILQDDSGSIKLTLWNNDASRFKEKDRIRIKNGYVSEFQGELQLTSGKFGTIEKVADNINEVSDDNGVESRKYKVVDGKEIPLTEDEY